MSRWRAVWGSCRGQAEPRSIPCSRTSREDPWPCGPITTLTYLRRRYGDISYSELLENKSTSK